MPKQASPEIAVPSPHNWRTTDEDEVNRRRARARTEEFRISNTDPCHPIFSNFRVRSGSGFTYSVEVRDVRRRQFACDCVDFRINGLGTCKHVEATLIWLKRRFKGEFRAAEQSRSNRIDLVPAGDTLCIERNLAKVPSSLDPLFDTSGQLLGDPGEAIDKLRRYPRIRISQDVEPFLESRRRTEQRVVLRRDYETGVIAGRPRRSMSV